MRLSSRVAIIAVWLWALKASVGHQAQANAANRLPDNARSSEFQDIQNSSKFRDRLQLCRQDQEDGEYTRACMVDNSEEVNPTGKADPGRSFIDKGLPTPFYQGMEATVALNLRDSEGRRIWGCESVESLHIWAEPDIIGPAQSACDEQSSLLWICFVSQHPEIVLTVSLNQVPLPSYPMTFNPTNQANTGCCRPGVQSLVSRCSRFDGALFAKPTAELSEESQWEWGEENAAVVLGASKIQSEALNVWSLSNVCIVNRTLVLFDPSGYDERSQNSYRIMLTIAGHAWGLWDNKYALMAIRMVRKSISEFAESHGVPISDGDAGSGPGPVYLTPEGPTTHFGHTIMDTILPLFATCQLFGDERSNKFIVLFPSYKFLCPQKGPTQHSRRFWDLFNTVTRAPRSNVNFLFELGNKAYCVRKAALGQALDQRVGHWIGFDQARTMPFAEDLREAMQALRANFDFARFQSPFDVHSHQVTLIQRKTRRIINDGEIIRSVKNLGLSVRAVDWHKMSLNEQMEVMSRTSVLIGIHGTGLNNAAFARPGSALIDILPYCFSNASDFWEISQAMWLRHYAWRNPDPARASCSADEPLCGIPDCGFDPPSSKFVMGGGVPNIQLHDTEVSSIAMSAILQHAVVSIQNWDGVASIPTSCSTQRGQETEVLCTHTLVGPWASQ